MTDYTKDQEREALESVAGATIWEGSPWVVVRAMAKRTEAAEAESSRYRQECDDLRASHAGDLRAVNDALEWAHERHGERLPPPSKEVRALIAAHEGLKEKLEVAEARADASEADAKRLADDWAAVLVERDALKARVAELEAKSAPAWVALDADTREVLAEGEDIHAVGEQAAKTGRSYILDKHHPPAITRLPPTVAPTREVWELLAEFAQSFAHWEIARNGGDGPMNDAARLVAAIRKMLEVGA